MQDMLSVLLAPIGGERLSELDMLTAWHGRLMVLAWAFAAPLAVLLARFYKVMPGQQWPQELDNKTWWHGHRALNYLAVALTLLGIGLVWGRSAHAGGLRDVHALAGWTVLSLALVQVLSAHARGSKGGPTAPRLDASGQVLDLHGDHYDMTLRRRLFERVHKSLGHLAWVLAWAALLAGLRLAHAPVWMGLLILLWWTGLLLIGVRLQRAGRCLDTYQAIWGPDPVHPGQRRRPIGWGVRRVAADTAFMNKETP